MGVAATRTSDGASCSDWAWIAASPAAASSSAATRVCWQRIGVLRRHRARERGDAGQQLCRRSRHVKTSVSTLFCSLSLSRAQVDAHRFSADWIHRAINRIRNRGSTVCEGLRVRPSATITTDGDRWAIQYYLVALAAIIVESRVPQLLS